MSFMKLKDENGRDVIINLQEVVTIRDKYENNTSSVVFKMSDGSFAFKENSLLADVEILIKKEILNTSFK